MPLAALGRLQAAWLNAPYSGARSWRGVDCSVRLLFDVLSQALPDVFP